MPTRNAINEYRKGSINGASPLQLVVMLYDGALRFMNAGRTAMTSGDVYGQNHNLQKAQRILTELICCLDMQKGGDVARNLMEIYSWAHNELVRANLEDDPAAIDACSSVLSELRDSWGQIEARSRMGAANAIA